MAVDVGDEDAGCGHGGVHLDEDVVVLPVGNEVVHPSNRFRFKLLVPIACRQGVQKYLLKVMSSERDLVSSDIDEQSSLQLRGAQAFSWICLSPSAWEPFKAIAPAHTWIGNSLENCQLRTNFHRAIGNRKRKIFNVLWPSSKLRSRSTDCSNGPVHPCPCPLNYREHCWLMPLTARSI